MVLHSSEGCDEIFEPSSFPKVKLRQQTRSASSGPACPLIHHGVHLLSTLLSGPLYMIALSCKNWRFALLEREKGTV